MTFRRFLALAVLVWSAFFFYGVAHAETQAASITTWRVRSDASTESATKSAACAKWGANKAAQLGGGSASMDGDTCRYEWPGVYLMGDSFIAGYGCPDASWSLNGQTCTRPDCAADQERDASGQCVAKCPAGQFRFNGTCVKDCSGKVGQSPPSPAYEFPNGGAQQVGGCEVECGQTISPTGSVVPPYVVAKNCKYTGKSYPDGAAGEGVGFKPTPEAPKKPGDCTGAGMGFIQSSSGTTTCVASKDSPPDNKPKTTEKKETTSGSPGTDGKPDPTKPDYEKKETTTSNGGGKTTTTETTTTNPDDSGACPAGATKVDGKCVKTKVTTENDSDFCTKNPNASQCKAETDDQECKDHPDRVGCMDSGEAPDEGAVENKSIGVSSISVVALAASNGCPSGVTLPKGLGMYNWEPICDYASALKPLVLAFAWLSAGLIVIGAIRD